MCIQVAYKDREEGRYSEDREELRCTGGLLVAAA